MPREIHELQCVPRHLTLNSMKYFLNYPYIYKLYKNKHILLLPSTKTKNNTPRYIRRQKRNSTRVPSQHRHYLPTNQRTSRELPDNEGKKNILAPLTHTQSATTMAEESRRWCFFLEPYPHAKTRRRARARFLTRRRAHAAASARKRRKLSLSQLCYSRPRGEKRRASLKRDFFARLPTTSDFTSIIIILPGETAS